VEHFLPNADKLSFQIGTGRDGSWVEMRVGHDLLSFIDLLVKPANPVFYSNWGVTLSRLTGKELLYFSCPMGQYWLVVERHYDG
jgi:hypothetical protein